MFGFTKRFKYFQIFSRKGTEHSQQALIFQFPYFFNMMVYIFDIFKILPFDLEEL